MELNMYVFGENEGIVTWVVAESKEQAVSIFQGITTVDINVECDSPDEYVREAHPGETMNYYHDGSNSEKETMQNLINKYCSKPDIFATSEF